MRGKTSAALLAATLSLLLLAPIATGQTTGLQNPNKSTPTTLYFHIFDIFNPFPINTQKPNVEFFEVGGTNFPTVVEPTADVNYDFNTMYGYSTSGPVEYDFIENGQPRFHPERGIAADVRIDTNAKFPVAGEDPATAVVHLYVDLLDVVGSHTLPNILPHFTFRVEMRTGNELNTDALGSGTLIMHGSKTMHLITEEFSHLNGTKDPNDIPYIMPNADGVIHYAIPLKVESPIIPKRDAYHMRIDWFQNPSGQPDQDDRTAEGYMRLVSKEGYHPRLELAIMNPVYIDFIHPQVAAGICLIHTAMNSPWGTYDVDVRNITVEIKDEKGNPVQAKLQQVTSQNAHVHNLHDKSAEVTYLWRFREQEIPDGKYTISVSVTNMAKTATASGTGQFILEGLRVYGVDQGGQIVEPAPETDAANQSSPGAGLLVALVILGAALLARRRSS